MIEYMIFLHGLAQQWRLTKNNIWHKGSLRHEDDAQTLNTRKITVTALCHNCAHSYAHSTDNSYTWTSELSFCLCFVCLSLSFLHIVSWLLCAWLSEHTPQTQKPALTKKTSHNLFRYAFYDLQTGNRSGPILTGQPTRGIYKRW